MEFQQKERYGMEDLRQIMRILRGEGGCPWDREQTHETIRKNFIEETYEAVEAIDRKDAAMLREELGDVLLQVIFHVQMEEEKQCFSFEDVTTEICQKLVVRHPHIFGDVTVDGVGEVLDNWNAIKQQTKGQTTVGETLEAVPKQLPALMRAEKVQSRAKKANAAFGGGTTSDAVETLAMEAAKLCRALEAGEESRPEEELGDLLFTAVNVARHCDLDPEEMLTRATDRFISRVESVEQSAGSLSALRELSTEQVQSLWEKAKNTQNRQGENADG